MLWWILGGLCILLVAAAVVIVAVITVRYARHEREVMEHGEAIRGWIVQANNVLWEEGREDNAAQILITFDRDLQHDSERMLELALKLGRLKEGQPADRMEAEIAQLVIDETARFSTRGKLPMRFTGGPTVYSTAVMVRRKYLPDGKISLPYVHCLALPGDDGGEVIMTEYPDEDERPPRTRRQRRD